MMTQFHYDNAAMEGCGEDTGENTFISHQFMLTMTIWWPHVNAIPMLDLCPHHPWQPQHDNDSIVRQPQPPWSQMMKMTTMWPHQLIPTHNGACRCIHNIVYFFPLFTHTHPCPHSASTSTPIWYIHMHAHMHVHPHACQHLFTHIHHVHHPPSHPFQDLPCPTITSRQHDKDKSRWMTWWGWPPVMLMTWPACMHTHLHVYSPLHMPTHHNHVSSTCIHIHPHPPSHMFTLVHAHTWQWWPSSTCIHIHAYPPLHMASPPLTICAHMQPPPLACMWWPPSPSHYMHVCIPRDHQGCPRGQHPWQSLCTPGLLVVIFVVNRLQYIYI